MKLVKTTLAFGDMARINSKLVDGELQQTVINEELAALIQEQLMKITKSKSMTIDSIETIVKNQEGYMHFNKRQGYNIVNTVRASIFWKYVRINNDNGGGLSAMPTVEWYEIVE